MTDEENFDLDLRPNGDESTRKRTLTPKGLYYYLEIKNKNLKHLRDKLGKVESAILPLLDTESEWSDYEHVRSMYTEWLNVFEKILQERSDFSRVIKTPETDISEEFYSKLSSLETFIDNEQCFKMKIDKWLQDKESERQKQAKDNDRLSLDRSSRKSRSVTSQVSSARLKEEQRMAELKAKEAALEEKQKIELEKQKLELEKIKLTLEEEKLNIKTEMAMSNARRKVIDEFESDTLLSQSSCRLSTKSKVKPPLILIDDKANATKDKQPQPVANSNSTNQEIVSVVQQLKKPVSDITVFNGNPLEYKKFMRQFKARIMLNTQDSDELLNYLEQYTSGDAKAIVSSYGYLNAVIGYPAAMKELKERYGDEEVIVSAFIGKALDWPAIKPDDPKALDKFTVFLSECEHAVESDALDNKENLKKLVMKLPYSYQEKFRTLVQRLRDTGEEIKFSNLVSLLKRESRKANDPMFGRDALQINDRRKKGSHKTTKNWQHKPKLSMVTGVQSPRTQDEKLSKIPDIPQASLSNPAQASTTPTPLTPSCIYCGAVDHIIDGCREFRESSFEEKTKFVKEEGLCFRCLKKGHRSKDCHANITCTTCQRRHNTLFHIDRAPPKEMQASSFSSRIQEDMGVGVTSDSACTMVIIPVKVKMTDGIPAVETYAFLDPGSSASFCTTDLMRQLSASGKPMKISIDSMGHPRTIDTYAVNGVTACSISMNSHVDLPTLYTIDKLPVSKAHIPTKEDISQWSHLHDLKIPQLDAEVGLLIGNNVADAYTPIDVRIGEEHSPHATRTRLGWALWNLPRHGATYDSEQFPKCTMNRTEIIAIQELEELQRLDRMVRHSYNIDFPERMIEDQKQFSQEDKMFMDRVEQSIRLRDGHYEIDLPFKDKEVMFPDNYSLAYQRLTGLKKRMEKDTQFHQEYTSFMENVCKKGYAELIPDNEPEPSYGRKWYIPHHGVYHPKKKKLRVVFNCAANYEGISLNDQLLSGPDLTNSLIGVLMRFRQERYAIMGDIESMFYQVLVPGYHQDYQRFLWWPNGDFNKSPARYRMKVHMFGTTSSPSCANAALLKTADDNEKDFDPEISQIIRKNFYVDDCLASKATVNEAVSTVKQVSSLCQKGGFHLTKWTSNSNEVLREIAPKDRALKVKDFELDKLSTGDMTERALGVTWTIHNDSIGFTVNPKSKDCTRRNILSVVSSLYDPLGLVSPYVLKAKMLLQDMCRLKLGWDELATGSHHRLWKQWISDLPRLQEISIPRCYKPDDSDEETSCQLHIFADASNQGYGVVAYLRFTYKVDKVHCILLMSKARVAPLKKVTIPRLELTAACVAVRLAHVIKKELQYEIQKTFFWTDSMSTIRYIRNESSRFRTFVANRIEVIRDGSEPHHWQYVPTLVNPADAASRGLSYDAFVQMNQWFEGPAFLWRSRRDWPSQNVPSEISSDDPEVKKTVSATMTSECVDSVERLLNYSSSWMKLKRIVSVYLFLKKILQHKVLKRQKLMTQLEQNNETFSSPKPENTYLSVTMLQSAELAIVKYVQKMHFPQLLKKLESSGSGQCEFNKQIRKLDPVLADGVIRVGGRLSNALILYEVKHPILMPKDSPVSKLIIEHCHTSVGHMGKAAVLGQLRQKFWIIRAGYLIKSIISRCVVCRKYTAQQKVQKMADIPFDRLKSDQPPFSNVGVDFFGPFLIKRSRATIKRYGVVFTCLTVRAVHLELAFTLNTSSCINAFRRFFARRGYPNRIRSDNGSNLVGCEREMREEIQKWNLQKINKECTQRGVEWEFNPPSGSHHGGIWERMIRTIRRILYSILHDQVIHLDDEGLQTVFCEVESIINNRPITTVSTDLNDLTPLTPNHLLLLHGNQQLPPGTFCKDDCYARRRWKQIQYLSDIFWRRWSREYITMQQERQKWTCEEKNVAVNDVVLVMDNLPRNAWCLGRVLDVFPDKRSHVRVVTLKTLNGTLKRPIDKLCVIVETDNQVK